MNWFSEWGSRLNAQHAGLRWWSYSSTARNLLSSAFGLRVIEALAICNLARSGTYRHLYIAGATHGQMRSIQRLLAPEFQVRLPANSRLVAGEFFAVATTMFRTLIQAARIALAFPLAGRRYLRNKPAIDTLLFTYLDGDFDPDWDRYFGDLPKVLGSRGGRMAYIAYVYTPYAARLHALGKGSAVPYYPLYRFLTAGDLLTGSWNAMTAAIRRPSTSGDSDPVSSAMQDILRETFLEDVSTRGYLHNLLVHAAALRMARNLRPQNLIYPYENKSLEKALLLAVREASPGTKIVGYQHTSITPRHIGLRFSREEARNTPLPDRIVTVGEITRKYLEEHGNYPKQMLVAGCALRQVRDKPLALRAPTKDRPRVLLALSSSIGELVSAVEFMRQVKSRLPGMEIGVRPHLNFPLQKLPADSLAWVRKQAIDLSGTRLRDNLEWADMTAYVSSTVALESLMLGRPVLHLDIDPGNPDPLLGNPRFRWAVRDPDGFLAAVASLSGLDSESLIRERDAALAYVSDYLAPRSPEALSGFVAAESTAHP